MIKANRLCNDIYRVALCNKLHLPIYDIVESPILFYNLNLKIHIHMRIHK